MIIRILILEDDLKTLITIFEVLSKLEDKWENDGKVQDLAVTVFSEYTQVQDYLNKTNEINFDVILLDRDCKLGGSFHVLDFEKFGVEKIIGISSVPPYNDELRARGVKRIVDKDYQDLQTFSLKLFNLLSETL